MTAQDLILFEEDIAAEFAAGKIKYPVHLRSGREEQLIEIFSRYNIGSSDWVFGYWDSHELALLKGVPKEMVKYEIMAGHSIALNFPGFNVFCSGIVGSLCGVSVGVAAGLTKGRVFHFCGDMSAETGIFHEAVKYAEARDLSIHFIVGDNGLSVLSKTKEVWGERKHNLVERFTYVNGYPHSGLNRKVAF